LVRKGEAAAARMTGFETGQVEVRRLALRGLSSVREFADGVDRVDVLINNAGIMARPTRRPRTGSHVDMLQTRIDGLKARRS
jgi:NADP-dependent 3-hydroxy acid dehydrogenase YdfG